MKRLAELAYVLVFATGTLLAVLIGQPIGIVAYAVASIEGPLRALPL